jgi:hypothetical protein
MGQNEKTPDVTYNYVINFLLNIFFSILDATETIFLLLAFFEK